MLLRVTSPWVYWVCLHVCVHASSPHPATSAYCVNRGTTHRDRERERESCGLDRSAGLWAISARSRSDKLQTEGGEKAAAAGGDLWHSKCTVKCSLHGYGGSDRGIKLWIYSCLPAGQSDGTVRTGAGVDGMVGVYVLCQSVCVQSLSPTKHYVAITVWPLKACPHSFGSLGWWRCRGKDAPLICLLQWWGEL